MTWMYPFAPAVVTGPTLLVSDDFNRTIAIGSGLGTADLGGAWTSYNNIDVSNARFGVNGTQARMEVAAASSSANALLQGSTYADVDILAKFQSSTQPVGGNIQFVLQSRVTAVNGDMYRARITQNTDGTTSTLRFSKVIANVSTDIGSTVTGSMTPSTWYNARFQNIGTVLRLKVWQDGTSEPGTWGIDITDTAVTAAGWVGFRGLVATGNTSVPHVILIESFSVR